MGSPGEFTALRERHLRQREMAELSRATARQQRLDAIGRRNRAKQRAGQRIAPMWRARSAAYDRFGPVMAVWLDGEEAAPDGTAPEAQDLRSLAAYAEISLSLLRGDEMAAVLALVVSHAGTVFDGRDVWIAGAGRIDGNGSAPKPRPAVQLPISSNGRVIAVLCVAGPDRSAPAGQDLDDGRRFAERVSLMIGLAQDRADREARLVRTAGQLQQALDSRVVIEQAKGILAAELNIGLDAAFERVRSHARAHQTTVQQIAAAVVKLGLRP